MKQILVSFVALITGFFTLIFAAVLGLFVTAVALLARPFVAKKIKKAQQQAREHQEREFGFQPQPDAYNDQGSMFKGTKNEPGKQRKGTVLEGDYQDVTGKQ